MWNWVLASSFVQNQINDLIRAACYSAGAYAVAHGIVQSTAENDLIGALFFLGTAGWQYAENRMQHKTKQSLVAQVAAGKVANAGSGP
jgi:hypothetical protein